MSVFLHTDRLGTRLLPVLATPLKRVELIKMADLRDTTACSEWHIPDIAGNITRWRDVAPYLGLSQPDIEVVEIDGVGEEDKRRKMLYKWLRMNGKDATFDKLIEAFEDSDNKDVADTIRAIKYKINQPQQQTRSQQTRPSQSCPQQPHPGPSPAEAAFTELQDSMKDLLLSCVASMATKCWAKALINQDLYSSVLDHNYEPTQTRVDHFLLEIVKTVEAHEKNNDQRRAREVIQKLADIVGYDSALSSLSQEIGDLCSSAELRADASCISTQLYSCLSTVASHAVSQNLITEDTYSMTIDPAASHDELCLNKILLSVKRAIRSDPTAIESFIDVLYDIGPPVSNIVKNLRAKMEEFS